jgi:uncharacterized membrane protein
MFGKDTKKAFWTGMVALLPTALTLILIIKAYQLVAGTIGKGFTTVITAALKWLTPWSLEYIPEGLISAAGVILAIVFVFFLGMALASLIGRRTWTFVEARFVSLPLIRSVYPSVKQITDFLFAEKKFSFRQVVALEYPRKGIWSLAFITGKAFSPLPEMTGKEMVTVFVPSSPTPFTGYCVQVAREELVDIDISVDAAIRYVVSGGVLMTEGDWAGTACTDMADVIGVTGGAAVIRENIGSQE